MRFHLPYVRELSRLETAREGVLLLDEQVIDDAVPVRGLQTNAVPPEARLEPSFDFGRDLGLEVGIAEVVRHQPGARRPTDGLECRQPVECARLTPRCAVGAA